MLQYFGRSSGPDFLGHVAGKRQGQTQILWSPHDPVISYLTFSDHDLGACLRTDLFILS